MYYQPETVAQAELMGPINYLKEENLLFRPNEYEIEDGNLEVDFIKAVDSGVVYYNYFYGPKEVPIILTSTSELNKVTKIKVKKRA